MCYGHAHVHRCLGGGHGGTNPVQIQEALGAASCNLPMISKMQEKSKNNRNRTNDNETGRSFSWSVKNVALAARMSMRERCQNEEVVAHKCEQNIQQLDENKTGQTKVESENSNSNLRSHSNTNSPNKIAPRARSEHKHIIKRFRMACCKCKRRQYADNVKQTIYRRSW